VPHSAAKSSFNPFINSAFDISQSFLFQVALYESG
jgi:hypothetical protein